MIYFLSNEHSLMLDIQTVYPGWKDILACWFVTKGERSVNYDSQSASLLARCVGTNLHSM